MPADAQQNDACWTAYRDAIARLGFTPTGLGEWGIDALKNLMTWFDAGVRFFGAGAQWTASEIGGVIEGLERVKSVLGFGATTAALGMAPGISELWLYRDSGMGAGRAQVDSSGAIHVGDFSGFSSEFFIESMIHEMGHVVDQTLGGGPAWSISDNGPWRVATDWQPNSIFSYVNIGGYWDYWHGVSGDTVSFHADENPWEDFAETFTWYIETANGGKYDNARRPPSSGRVASLTVALNSNYYTCLPPTCYR